MGSHRRVGLIGECESGQVASLALPSPTPLLAALQRPWGDFFARMPSKPVNMDWPSLEKHVFTNLLYFRANYFVVAGVVTAYSVCVTTCLVVWIVLQSCTFFFLHVCAYLCSFRDFWFGFALMVVAATSFYVFAVDARHLKELPAGIQPQVRALLSTGKSKAMVCGIGKQCVM
jgi:hypothetical protein